MYWMLVLDLYFALCRIPERSGRLSWVLLTIAFVLCCIVVAAGRSVSDFPSLMFCILLASFSFNGEFSVLFDALQYLIYRLHFFINRFTDVIVWFVGNVWVLFCFSRNSQLLPECIFAMLCIRIQYMVGWFYV